MKELSFVSNEIQYIVIRNSKLAEPRRSASQWIKWHKKTTPTPHPLRNMRDIGKNWYISLNKSGKNAPMRLRSDCRTAVTIMNRPHRPEPIPYHQYQRWHSSSSSSSSSWWQWDKNWWSSLKIVVEGSFTADGNLLQPTGCVNSTLHTSPFFSCLRACVRICHTTVAQVCASSHPCVMRLSV